MKKAFGSYDIMLAVSLSGTFQGKQRVLYSLLDAMQSVTSQGVVIGISCRLVCSCSSFMPLIDVYNTYGIEQRHACNSSYVISLQT